MERSKLDQWIVGILDDMERELEAVVALRRLSSSQEKRIADIIADMDNGRDAVISLCRLRDLQPKGPGRPAGNALARAGAIMEKVGLSANYPLGAAGTTRTATSEIKRAANALNRACGPNEANLNSDAARLAKEEFLSARARRGRGAPGTVEKEALKLADRIPTASD